ncbi:hypothetical protein [Photorhabdus laumondii]|uniref:hypothetical protein n=1 Tax=Photorhabdus laumondii TaxID=2218628 RepID=UPI003314CF40
MTGVSECSQQRGNLKDNGYKYRWSFTTSSINQNNLSLKLLIKSLLDIATL